jgi:hypothetical protein
MILRKNRANHYESFCGSNYLATSPRPHPPLPAATPSFPIPSTISSLRHDSTSTALRRRGRTSLLPKRGSLVVGISAMIPVHCKGSRNGKPFAWKIKITLFGGNPIFSDQDASPRRSSVLFCRSVTTGLIRSLLMTPYNSRSTNPIHKMNDRSDLYVGYGAGPQCRNSFHRPYSTRARALQWLY